METHTISSASKVLPVLSSTAHAVSRGRHVSLHRQQVAPAVSNWGHLLVDASNWQHPCHYFEGTAETVRWIFILDVLNHCFWPDPGQAMWSIADGEEMHSGYWGLAASLKRAMENRFPITNAEYLAQIPERDLQAIFSGTGQIPLFKERLFNLREAGRVLASQWQGDIVNLLAAAGGSAVRAVSLITSSFPSFRDQASHHGHTVYFWKRAQLFIADLHLAFKGESFGRFADIDRLTAFADYKLPQVLREFEVFSYEPELVWKIDHLQNLAAQSEEEVEIRAATIWAVEAFREAFAQTGQKVNSIQIDNWLWQLGQLEPFRQRPYHRCRTIFY